MSPDTPDTSSRLGPSLCFQIQNERLLVRAFADTALCFNYLLVSRVAVPEDRYKQAVRERVQRKRAFLKSRGVKRPVNYFRKVALPHSRRVQRLAASPFHMLEIAVMQRIYEFIRTHELHDISLSMASNASVGGGGVGVGAVKPVRLVQNRKKRLHPISLSLGAKEEVKSKRQALIESMRTNEALDFAQYHPEPEDIIPEHKEEGSLQVTIEQALKRQGSLIHVTLDEQTARKQLGLASPSTSKSSKNLHRFNKITPRCITEDPSLFAKTVKGLKQRGAFADTPTSVARYKVAEGMVEEGEGASSLMVEDVE